MHQKTETKAVFHWREPVKKTFGFDDLKYGTYIIDEDCELYVKCGSLAVNVSTGMGEPGHRMPLGWRVVPRVTFHVELEGEG